MTEAGALTGIGLERFFPLRLLLRSLRLAVGARALALSTLGLVLTLCGWAACGKLFGIADDAAINVSSAPLPWKLGEQGSYPTIDWSPQTPWLAEHALLAPWLRLSGAFMRALDPNLSCREFFCLLSCGLWAIVLWGLLGGMIARSAAVGLAREERVHWRPLRKFVLSRWTSIIAAPICVLVGIALVALPVVVVGWFMRFSFGMLVAGLLWPLVLAAGVVLTLLALGLLFGWPLMWAAVAAEGADAFEAISRAYTYVFHRPLVYLLYVAQAVVLRRGWLLVVLFVLTLHGLCNSAASWGWGPIRKRLIGRPDLEGLEAAGGGMIRFWRSLLLLYVPAAFSYSYLWNASTAIYFALRREVEATELGDVFIPEEAEARYGLPPLEAETPDPAKSA